MKHALHVVTNTEVSTHRQCPARWGFAYGELLRPMVKAGPLQWGELYHYGAEVGWNAAWSVAEMSTDARLNAALGAAPIAIGERAAEHIRVIEATDYPAEVDKNALCEETEQSAKVASWSVAHYFARARGDLSMVPLMIEGKYTMPMPNAAGMPSGTLATAGVIDLLLWDRELGRLVVQDHKGIASDVHSVEKRVELDTQLVGYVCAVKMLVRQLGGPKSGQLLSELFHTTQAARLVAAQGIAEIRGATIGAVTYNVARRKMPSEPKLNLLKKNACVTPMHRELLAQQEADGEPRGEVSVAQIDTLPEVYQRALEAQIVERELPATEKQQALLATLRQRGDTYFSQIEYFKSADAIERWRKELWVEAKRIRAAERDPSLRTRNPLACTLPTSPACPYAAVCLTPDDPIARKAYRVAASKHEELNDDGNGDESGDQGQEQGQSEVGW